MQTIDIDPGTVLGDPEAIYEALRESLAYAGVEYFCAIPLDREYRALGPALVVAEGNSRRVTDITPPLAFRYAIETQASRIVFAHNHPSGKLQPSKDDLSLTRRLQAAGQILAIPVVDHVIVARSGCYGILMAAALSSEKGTSDLFAPLRERTAPLSEGTMLWMFLLLLLHAVFIAVIVGGACTEDCRSVCRCEEVDLSANEAAPPTRALDGYGY